MLLLIQIHQWGLRMIKSTGITEHLTPGLFSMTELFWSSLSTALRVPGTYNGEICDQHILGDECSIINLGNWSEKVLVGLPLVIKPEYVGAPMGFTFTELIRVLSAIRPTQMVAVVIALACCLWWAPLNDTLHKQGQHRWNMYLWFQHHLVVLHRHQNNNPSWILLTTRHWAHFPTGVSCTHDMESMEAIKFHKWCNGAFSAPVQVTCITKDIPK